MTDEPDRRAFEARMLATLEAILATQQEFLADLRRSNSTIEARADESVRLQREAAERGALALQTQQSGARLYRRALLTLAVILIGLIGAGIYFSIVG